MATIALAHFLKAADSSGDGNDTSYEQAMSQIADAIIKDKAPSLVAYELGFQLLDRDEDNNKAFGVKVFKIGKFWLYVPLFLLQGKVKGTDILYIKNQNICVPLQDDWIRYIMNKKAIALGNQVPRNKHFPSNVAPDFRQLSRPPAKYASANPTDFAQGVALFKKEVLPQWARGFTSDPLAKLASYGLCEFLADAGQPALRALHAMVEECPAIAHDIKRFHKKAFDSACKQAAAKPGLTEIRAPRDFEELLEEHRPKQAALQIFTYERILADDSDDLLDDFVPDVPDDPDDVTVVDGRPDDNISEALEEDTTRQLRNPDNSGIYDVLVRPLVYERCAVLMHPARPDSIRSHYATLVKLSDKTFVQVHASKIWVGREYGDAEWKEFFDDLPDAGKSIETDDPADNDGLPSSYRIDAHRKRYIFITPNRDSTAPLRIEHAIGDTDGGTSYEISADECVFDDKPSVPYGSTQNTDRRPRPGASGETGSTFSCYGHALNLGTSRGSKIWSANRNLFVPEGAKQLAAKRAKHDSPLLQLGDPTHITLGLISKTLPLKVAFAQKQVLVNNRSFSKRDALIHLIQDHGLRKDAAAAVLDRAHAVRHAKNSVFTCRIKYADNMAAQDYPNAPSYPSPYETTEPLLYGGSVPGDPAQYDLQRVGDMQGSPDAQARYDINVPPPQLLEHIQSAAQTGQKEVFDTAMIGSITQASHAGLEIDKYLGRLMSGLDSTGWLLMNLWWHNDEFAERYGKEDISPLENTMRNVFVETGKLILNLKQKGVEDPLDTQQELDLSPDDQ